MDYQHVNTIKESIDSVTSAVKTPVEAPSIVQAIEGMTQAVQTPASVQVSLTELADLSGAVAITGLGQMNTFEQSMCIAALAAAITALPIIVTAVLNHNTHKELIKERQHDKKAEEEMRLANKREETYKIAIQFYHDFLAAIIEAPEKVANGSTQLTPENKNPAWPIYASKEVMENARVVEDIISNEWQKFQLECAKLYQAHKDVEKVRNKVRKIEKVTFDINIADGERSLAPYNKHRKEAITKLKTLSQEKGELLFDAYLSSLDIFEVFLIASTNTMNAIKKELHEDADYIENVESYAKERADNLRKNYNEAYSYLKQESAE